MTPWIQTFTGRAFDLFDPQPDQICLEDIAHSLSQICRFTGHCGRFYSVAEHCWEMSDLIESDDPAVKLAALMHDAHEAYLGDISSPMGFHVLLVPPGCVQVETTIRLSALKTKIQAAIHAALRIPLDHIDHPLIKAADLKMLASEKRDLMRPEPRPWIELPDPYKQSFRGEWKWNWPEVFKEKFHRLQSKTQETAP
jgi:hypothetical protein